MPANALSKRVFRALKPAFCTAACCARATISAGEDTFIRISVTVCSRRRSVGVSPLVPRTAKVSKKQSSARDVPAYLSTKFCQRPSAGGPDGPESGAFGRRVSVCRASPERFFDFGGRLVLCRGRFGDSSYRPCRERPVRLAAGRRRRCATGISDRPPGGKKNGNFALFPKSRIFATYLRIVGCVKSFKKVKNACKNQISASR